MLPIPLSRPATRITIGRSLLLLFLTTLLSAGCVTRTERVPYRPYVPRQDEGLLAELGRELGWQSPSTQPGEPFYKRAARRITGTVAGWFQREEPPASAKELEAFRRRFEQEQQEAFRRLREQQEQDLSVE